MLETGYKAPRWESARIAHGYQNGRDWGTIVDRIAVEGAPYWALRGNGGLHTTLGDIARWDAALDNRSVLTDSSRVKFMTGYVNEGPEGRSQYAYGWAVMKTSRGTRLVTHNGGNGVYVAELLRFVNDRVTIFVASTVSELTGDHRRARHFAHRLRAAVRTAARARCRCTFGDHCRSRHVSAGRRQPPGGARPGRPVDRRSGGPAGVRAARHR